MHRWIAAAAAIAAAGLAGSALAGADTDVPYGITVNGSASEVVAAGASTAQLQSDYLAELAAAIGAAHTKALFVAARLNDTLTGVEGFVENSDVPTQACTVGPIAAAVPGVRNGTPKPGAGKGKGKRTAKGKSKNGKAATPRKTALIITPGGCEVTASVTETFGDVPLPPSGPSGPTGATGVSGPTGASG